MLFYSVKFIRKIVFLSVPHRRSPGKEHQRAVCSDNLLTGNEQLSINNSIEIYQFAFYEGMV